MRARARVMGLARAVAAVALCASSAAPAATPAITAPAVAAGRAVTIDTPSGELRGFDRNGIVAYLGIPYAAPPVEQLRWRPPQALPRWRGLVVAGQYGNDCTQGRRAAVRGGEPIASEDCLFLNVWTPVHAGAAGLPVMVWVHGGAFVVGSGSQALYDGANLARRGAVVVTFNYRLGRFGFFAHPALAKEHPAEPIGNYGLMDQIAALKWVKANIEAFGGDPQRVTLFGQSAGGASVTDLMTSPMARGLFDRAIIESGVFATPATTLQEAEREAQDAAKSWGLAAPSATALRRVPAEKLLGSGGPLAVRAGPMIDGKILPRDPIAAFEAGKVAHVPLIIGSNSYEAAFFPERAHGLALRFAAEWPKIQALFDGYGTHQRAAIEGELATDMMVTAPTWRVARAAARDGLPTYLYYFTYLRPSQRGRLWGPSHIDEVYAVFDHMGLIENDTGPDTRRMVDEVQSRWVEFARTGRPAAASAGWRPVVPGALEVLELSNSGPLMRADFASRRLKLASALAPRAR